MKECREGRIFDTTAFAAVYFLTVKDNLFLVRVDRRSRRFLSFALLNAANAFECRNCRGDSFFTLRYIRTRCVQVARRNPSKIRRSDGCLMTVAHRPRRIRKVMRPLLQ